MALLKCNYKVLEYGRLLKDSQALDRPYSTYRIKHLFNRGAQFYAEYNIRLFFFLLFSKFDLVFANDLDTLPAAFLAAKIKRKKLIYDTHEYFTATPELMHRPTIQKIWMSIESCFFPKLKHVITVNSSIANLYEKQFNKKISVVRNIPLSYTPKKNKSRTDLNLPVDKKIIIIQGTGINIERGAEEACKAMQFLENVILLIIGSGDVMPILKKIVADNHLEAKVLFKSKMPFQELRAYTMNCDLGLTIDKGTNINYIYSLPNKLFDYIHAGIPVLSSELVEIKNIIENYHIGYFILNHNPQHIAQTINKIFSDQATYDRTKENTITAKKHLCWEEEEKILLNIIHSI
jgi:glycosyltransferase involved in cell wall biosynthesis